jgi:hypothetical protein
MEQGMTGRLRIGTWMIAAGCFLFTVYGIGAAVFSEPIAAYQYQAAGSGDLHALPDAIQEFSSVLVMIIGLLGAGLAICSGALFWLGLSRGIRGAFLAGLIGGAIGLTGLLVTHLHHSAWFLFIADNLCLFFIGTGITIATREIFDLVRGKPEQDHPGAM